MLAFVSPSTDEMNNKFVTFPWLWKREGGFHQFKFVVPGITYLLCVGKMVPAEFRDSCAGSDIREGGFCAILIRASRKSLISNGEMSEWSKEHAWKTNPATLTERYRNTPSRN